MNSVVIRPAEHDDLDEVADLRWRWVLENQGTPVTSHEEFVRHFGDWARENAHSHRCLVMLRGGLVVGMAWLAITPRVPSPRALERASGDVQCVYVVPGERSGGLGGLLIRELLKLAGEQASSA